MAAAPEAARGERTCAEERKDTSRRAHYRFPVLRVFLSTAGRPQQAPLVFFGSLSCLSLLLRSFARQQFCRRGNVEGRGAQGGRKSLPTMVGSSS